MVSNNKFLDKFENNSYSSIIKSISLITSVQILVIIFSVIKSKLAAILIGPIGFGIIGLLSSSSNLISNFTGFGLNRSAVKSIASTDIFLEPSKINKTVTILRILVLFTGIVGAVSMYLFAPYLSIKIFDNKAFVNTFKFISITLFINQINECQIAILRGTSSLNYIAKSNILSSFFGLVFSIPLYYFFGQNGIVPAIIITSITSLFISNYFTRKLKIKNIYVSFNEFKTISNEMISIGTSLTISSAFILIATFLINIYIRSIGGVEDVGFYNAGFTIINSYFGIIFISLTSDYYPKLAKIANNKFKAIKLINEQSEITLMIIAPMLLFFLVFSNLILRFMYSSDFLIIEDMLKWAILGIFFKASSWSLGVIYISKGDIKFIILTELVSNTILLIFSILSYQYYGLEGLGFSYFFSFISTYLLTFFIVTRVYKFKYDNRFKNIFLVQLIFICITFIIVKYGSITFKYIFGTLLIACSLIYSFYNLIEMFNIKFNNNSILYFILNRKQKL